MHALVEELSRSIVHQDFGSEDVGIQRTRQAENCIQAVSGAVNSKLAGKKVIPARESLFLLVFDLLFICVWHIREHCSHDTD